MDLVNKKKLYLYNILTMYRHKIKTSQIDLSLFCKYLGIAILNEVDNHLFMDNEKAYFIIYSDCKSCIVIKDELDIKIRNEIIAYSVFKILLLTKFSNNEFENKTKVYKNTSLHVNSMDDICKALMYEVLIPSSEVAINLYYTLNSSKINTLASYYNVSYTFASSRIELLVTGAKTLLEGVAINKLKAPSNYNY